MTSSITSERDTGTPGRRRPRLWWGLATAALVLGYGDLWRGGITLGPTCLVLGYCVLVPIAIMRG